jgi:hypothetical protein
VWENFFARNPGLEILRLSRNTTFDMMKLAFDNLAQLKRLVIRGRVIIREEQQNDLIKFLENNLNRLEMFNIHFCFRNNPEMLDVLKKSLPNFESTIEDDEDEPIRMRKLILESKNFDGVRKISVVYLVRILEILKLISKKCIELN